MKSLLIGGTHSGCGKTTITCAIMQALIDRGLKVSSFKCGPDYIDPMFHSRVILRPFSNHTQYDLKRQPDDSGGVRRRVGVHTENKAESFPPLCGIIANDRFICNGFQYIGADPHNLDGFFCDDETLRYLFSKHSKTADISVAEGVMGFYDGVCGRASSRDVSNALNIPAVIVIDCKGMGASVGAVIKGFLEYRPNNVKGFIFNRLSERLIPEIKQACDELGTLFLGSFPYCKNAAIESRHLGLVSASEISDLKQKMHILANEAEKNIDLDKLLEIAETEAFSECKNPVLSDFHASKKVRIAIANDNAFSFIYRENLELLRELGCDIKFFSPLTDKRLPENISGLILPGGYPELYAKTLSENSSMTTDIREKILGGLPTIAECGGFLYLGRTLADANGAAYPMVGVFDTAAQKTEKLQRFGYATLTAKQDNLLCKAGESFPAHEFHYWESDDCGSGFSAEKASSGTRYDCVFTSKTMYAGFPHLYFYAKPQIAVNYVKECQKYGENKEHNSR